MDKKELRKLSKRELLLLITEQQEQRIQFLEEENRILKEKLAKLEQLLKAFDNPHTPSSKVRSKKNTERDESTARFPGKPEGSKGAGIQMPAPDQEVEVKKDSCPDCGDKLGNPYNHYTFRQMDIPQPQFVTTQYHVALYHCSCGAEIDAGSDLQQGFYGPNTTAFLGSLRTECLSYEAISRLLKETYKLKISNVAVFNKLTMIASLMSSERELIRKAINDGDAANMDETGLRKDGKNGQVWNASTAEYCLFEYDRSRGADVAKRILNSFAGILTTDDFKSYYWYELRQLCWAHLLREAKEFAEKYSEAKIQYERLKVLYNKSKLVQEMQDVSKYDALAVELEDIATCYHPMDGCRIMYGKIHNRTALWLRAVKYPLAQLTNNRAERNLRKVVLHRNRMGCIRNEKGEAFVNNFLTCTSTWQIQGKNTYEKLLTYAKLT